MPKFSQKSLDKLMTCHEDLQFLFNEVIKDFDCTILCGYRGQEEQEKAFNEGNSKLKWPNSKHNRNPSIATDVIAYPIDWDNLGRFYFFGGYVLGVADRLYKDGLMKHKVRWGGDFDMDHDPINGKFFDGVHFELMI